MTETGASGARPAYRIPALDGLRGFAVLCILFWHYFHFWRGFDLFSRFVPTWTSIDLFFVLSGYLITGRLNETAGSPHYFSHFYRNRILRVFPLYYAVVIAFFLFTLTVKQENLYTFDIYLAHWKSFFIFTQNWTFILFGLPRDLSLVPLWSLAVEEQFYLTWPLILFLIPAGRLRIRVFTILVALVVLVRTAFYLRDPASAGGNYYNTLFRIDSLIIGGILYQIHQNGIRKPGPIFRVILYLLLAAFFVCNYIFVGYAASPSFSPFFSTLGYTVTAILYAWLLHSTVFPAGGFFNRVFSLRFLRYCGKISYCLYLVHMPVQILMRPRIFYWIRPWCPGSDYQVKWIAVGGCLLLSFLISTLSYYYFESYFLRLKK